MTNIKNKDDAKSLANSVNAETKNAELNKILKLIDNRASLGYYQLELYKIPTTEVLDNLKNSGFTVKVYQDQRDGDLVKISWK